MDWTQLSAETPCFLMAAGTGFGCKGGDSRSPDLEEDGAGGERVEDTEAMGSGSSIRAARAYSGLVGSDMPQETHTWGSRLAPASSSSHCSGKE